MLVVAARAHATCDVPWTTPQDTLASLAAAAERCDAIRVAAPPGGGDLGSLVDRFLAPRVRWRVAGEAPDGATLERFPADARRDRYLALLDCALHGSSCGSVRVASVPGGGGFFGMHMMGLARALEASIGRRAPSLAVVPRGWGYGNASDAACEGLGCYFLPSTACAAPFPAAALLEPCGKKGLARHVEGAALRCRDRAPAGSSCWRADPELEAARSQFGEGLGMARELYDAGAASLATLLVTALRPNARTRAAVAARSRRWASGTPAWAARSRCAAVHVRHGDKLTEVWLRARPRDASFNLTLDDYVRAAVGARAGPGDVVLLTTDDRDILDAAPAAAARYGVPVVSVPAGRPLQSTARINRLGLGAVKHQGGCARAVKMARRAAAARAADGAAPRYRAPPTCALDYLRDPTTGEDVGGEELLQWLVAWNLMGSCDRFVGKPAESLFARFIFASMCVDRGACPELRSPGGGAWRDAY